MIEHCTIPSGEKRAFYKLWFQRAKLRDEVNSLTEEASRTGKRRARRRKTSWH